MPKERRAKAPTLVKQSGQDREDVLATIAQMYYLDNLTQRSIAVETGFSVATVSRMIAKARKSGLVSVRINRSPSHDRALGDKLCAAFGLEQAVVVTERGDTELDETGVHDAAVSLFNGMLSPGMTVGVTWGETLDKVIDRIEPRKVQGCEVVQVTGALGHGDTAIDGPGLAFRLADKLGAPCHLVNAPARVRSPQLRRNLVSQPQIRKAITRAAQADILLHGVGSLNRDSSLVRAGYITISESREALSKGAVAQVLAHIVDASCDEVHGFAGRTVGISLRDVARIGRSVGVIASKGRAEALAASLRGKLFTHLVTGEDTARKVLGMREAKAA